MITLETTVNQLLDMDTRWLAALNDLNVDTCCGGNHSLAQAAVGAGLSAEELLQKVLETQKKFTE